MGYTHYWKVLNWDSTEWQKAWEQLISDVPKIVEAADIELSGPTNDEDIVTPLIIDIKDGIFINGVGYDSHEPIVIQDGQWTFCKTARKPYDVVVITILVRAAMLAPNQFEVSSDGYWDEWCEGRELYQRLWPGQTLKCPFKQDDEEDEEEEGEEQDEEDVQESQVAPSWKSICRLG